MQPSQPMFPNTMTKTNSQPVNPQGANASIPSSRQLTVKSTIPETLHAIVNPHEKAPQTFHRKQPLLPDSSWSLPQSVHEASRHHMTSFPPTEIPTALKTSLIPTVENFSSRNVENSEQMTTKNGTRQTQTSRPIATFSTRNNLPHQTQGTNQLASGSKAQKENVPSSDAYNQKKNEVKSADFPTEGTDMLSAPIPRTKRNADSFSSYGMLHHQSRNVFPRLAPPNSHQNASEFQKNRVHGGSIDLFENRLLPLPVHSQPPQQPHYPSVHRPGYRSFNSQHNNYDQKPCTLEGPGHLLSWNSSTHCFQNPIVRSGSTELNPNLQHVQLERGEQPQVQLFGEPPFSKVEPSKVLLCDESRIKQTFDRQQTKTYSDRSLQVEDQRLTHQFKQKEFRPSPKSNCPSTSAQQHQQQPHIHRHHQVSCDQEPAQNFQSNIFLSRKQHEQFNLSQVRTELKPVSNNHDVRFQNENHDIRPQSYPVQHDRHVLPTITKQNQQDQQVQQQQRPNQTFDDSSNRSIAQVQISQYRDFRKELPPALPLASRSVSHEQNRHMFGHTSIPTQDSIRLQNTSKSGIPTRSSGSKSEIVQDTGVTVQLDAKNLSQTAYQAKRTSEKELLEGDLVLATTRVTRSNVGSTIHSILHNAHSEDDESSEERRTYLDIKGTFSDVRYADDSRTECEDVMMDTLSPRTLHESTPYTCAMCAARFGDREQRKLHIQNVHTRNYSCHVCNAAFTRRFDLEKHSLTVHEKVRPFPCDQCKSSFGQKHHLVRHKKAVHIKARDFACESCKSRFARKEHLMNHKRAVHDKYKPFLCSLCDVQYCEKRALRRHLEQVHSVKSSRSAALAAWQPTSKSPPPSIGEILQM